MTARAVYAIAFALCAIPTLALFTSYLFAAAVGGPIMAAMGIVGLAGKLQGGSSDTWASLAQMAGAGLLLIAVVVCAVAALKLFLQVSFRMLAGIPLTNAADRTRFRRGLAWAALPALAAGYVGMALFAGSADPADRVMALVATGLPLLVPVALLWRAQR